MIRLPYETVAEAIARAGAFFKEDLRKDIEVVYSYECGFPRRTDLFDVVAEATKGEAAPGRDARRTMSIAGLGAQGLFVEISPAGEFHSPSAEHSNWSAINPVLPSSEPRTLSVNWRRVSFDVGDLDWLARSSWAAEVQELDIVAIQPPTTAICSMSALHRIQFVASDPIDLPPSVHTLSIAFPQSTVEMSRRSHRRLREVHVTEANVVALPDVTTLHATRAVVDRSAIDPQASGLEAMILTDSALVGNGEIALSSLRTLVVERSTVGPDITAAGLRMHRLALRGVFDERLVMNLVKRGVTVRFLEATGTSAVSDDSLRGIALLAPREIVIETTLLTRLMGLPGLDLTRLKRVRVEGHVEVEILERLSKEGVSVVHLG